MPKDSYPFPIYSGLLEPSHYKKIGSAIWLFLWCISSTTREVERDGVTWGIVHGNKPHKLNELAAIFDVNERTVRRWLDDLEKHEYIKITRAPYGIILTIKNSKKYKDKSDKNVQSEDKKRVDKNVQSDRERTKMSNPERTNVSTLSDKNVHSNKDITKILQNTTTTNNKDDVDLIAERFTDLKTARFGKPSYPTVRDYEAIAQIVARGMPLSQTIELLEQCFAENPETKIHSFNYCKEFIQDRHEAILAKEKAKEGVTGIETHRTSSGYRANQKASGEFEKGYFASQGIARKL